VQSDSMLRNIYATLKNRSSTVSEIREGTALGDLMP